MPTSRADQDAARRRLEAMRERVRRGRRGARRLCRVERLRKVRAAAWTVRELARAYAWAVLAVVGALALAPAVVLLFTDQVGLATALFTLTAAAWTLAATLRGKAS